MNSWVDFDVDYVRRRYNRIAGFFPLFELVFLLPPGFTVRESAAPDSTLRATLVVLGLGAVVLLPSLWYLFQVFKTVPADPEDRAVNR